LAATSFYVAPSGSDSNSCSQSAPCATINRAYQISSPGDTVIIGAGEYPFQTINWRASMDNLSPGCDPYGTWGSPNTTNCITITTSGDVKIRGMYNYASGIWFKGTVGNANPSPGGNPQNFKNRTYNFHVTKNDLIGNPPPSADKTGCNCQSANFRVARAQDTSSTIQRPDHVIADGIDSDTASVYSGDYVLMRNMDIGPMWFDTPNPGSSSGAGPDVVRIWGASPEAGASANVVWDGNYVHEMNRTYDCDLNNACHNDGLYIVGGGPYTIRNSAFSQVAAENIFFEYFGGGYQNVHDVLIENNWFGCLVNSYPDNPASALNTCGASKSISFKNCAGPCENILVRYNSWYTAPNDNETSASFSNARFIGNAGAGPLASSKICTQATWMYNAFTSGGCGSNNATVSGGLSALFKNPAPGFEDFHLLNSTSMANNLVTPTSSDYSLGTDFDGQTRSVPRDAGADEYGTGSGGTSTTPTVSLSANPTSITSGQSSTLSWSSTNATSCTASGSWSGSKSTSGTQSVSPTTTSTYNLTCTGTGGSANASATVTVGTTSGPPTISSFSPTSGPVGTQVTINGANLDKATIVEFNQGGTVSYTINSPSKITATVPTGSQTGYISINQGQALSPQPFTVTASSPKTGDLNSDGSVNITDLSILLSSWNSTNSTADINKDSTVNILDLSILLSNYGA
jgi:hypothetical protein